MNRSARIGLFLLACLPGLVVAQTSADLLARAKTSIASMSGSFDGAFMQGAGRNRVPFVVETNRTGAMRYHFNNPGEIVSIVVGQAPDGNLTQPIRGTDVTVEDLSLWYLQWPAGEARTENSAGMTFWVVAVTNKTGRGSYSRAEIWIHQTSLGLYRVDAYDKQGNLARRLEVEHIREFGDQKIADRLRVSTYQGGSKASSTYVQLARERSPE
jgi:hypothetical protein